MVAEADGASDEDTHLLAPDPDSTGPVRTYSPLTSSYDDVRKSVELELKALTDSKKLDWKTSLPVLNTLNRRNAILMLLFGCGLLTLLATIFHGHGYTSHKSNQNKILSGQPLPFSKHDPVNDLQLLEYVRSKETAPPLYLFRNHDMVANGEIQGPLPTNAWYQNMLLFDSENEPSSLQRAYASPYLVDVVGLIPGLRVNPNYVLSGAYVLQLSFNEKFGLTIGATGDLQKPLSKNTHSYSVLSTNKLGLTLQWDAFPMTSSIVRGMPYTTMTYEEKSTIIGNTTVFPTIVSPISLGKDPIVDGTASLQCSESSPTRQLVQKDIELYFRGSDFSWLVFFF